MHEATASQMLYAPATALPTIVLPDFARSFSADGILLRLIRHVNIKTTAHKSGQRPAGKRGPGSFACGWKDFSGLMFGYFASKVK
jgi:hypothetical protein